MKKILSVLAIVFVMAGSIRFFEPAFCRRYYIKLPTIFKCSGWCGAVTTLYN